jgi:uncharacterized protein
MAASATPQVSLRSPAGLPGLLAAHPLPAYFAGAFAWSWVLWFAVAAGAPEVLILVGVFGPLASAVVVTRATGGSVRGWLRRILRWRVSPWWYGGVIAIPLALVAASTAIFAGFGEPVDMALLDEKVVAFAGTLLFVALLGGGQEEFGWRGLALPRLQERLSPVRATLMLGTLWALWHLPLLFAMDEVDHGLGAGALSGVLVLTMISIVAYAFAYTYVLNRTGSVLLCILLHGSFTTANGFAALRAEAELVGTDYALYSGIHATVLVAAALVLVGLTRGRLGRADE